MSSGADLFVVCKNCGSEVSPYITECPYCGSRLRKRAPKLDKARRQSQRAQGQSAPNLGRLRKGEIPGIRPDARPLATAALVVASIALSLAWRAGAVEFDELRVLGKLGDEWWRALSAPFAYASSGYMLCALVGVALFGWLLERRHGPLVVLVLFLLGAAGGMLVAAATEALPVASGANGGALALLAAWAIPDLQDRRRGVETESDMLGAGVIAAVLLLVPLVAPDEADPVAGVTGALDGIALGWPLAVLSRGR